LIISIIVIIIAVVDDIGITVMMAITVIFGIIVISVMMMISVCDHGHHWIFSELLYRPANDVTAVNLWLSACIVAVFLIQFHYMSGKRRCILLWLQNSKQLR